MKEKIQELERQIAALPIGYISKKTINGKTRYYHQWTENGKKHSQYLRDGELEPLQEQIEQRKGLQAQLKELQAKMPKVRQPKLDFETSVIVGAMRTKGYDFPCLVVNKSRTDFIADIAKAQGELSVSIELIYKA